MGRTRETEYANESTAATAIGKLPVRAAEPRETAGESSRFRLEIPGRVVLEQGAIFRNAISRTAIFRTVSFPIPYRFQYRLTFGTG